MVLWKEFFGRDFFEREVLALKYKSGTIITRLYHNSKTS